MTAGEPQTNQPVVLVLGPIAVQTASSAASALRGQQGRVLGLLAAEFPNAVSIDALMDELWPDGAPKSSRSGLAVVIHRVREQLRSCGRDLTNVGSSYLLQVEPEDLDSQLFAAMFSRAESGLESDPRQALEAVRIALDLWRGDAFAPFGSSPRLRLHASYLDGERLRAEEVFVDCLLATGQPDVAASWAARLAEAEPYRERRWELLMLALYRCGRQGEALRAAQRAKTVLADDLGLLPGPGLVHLESLMLAQAAELDLDAATVAAGPVTTDEITAPRSVVTSVPHVDGNFVGRQAEEEQLAALLATNRLVTLVGPAGAGKTRLAAQYAAGTLGDAPVWVDLLPATDQQVVAALAHALGVRVDERDLTPVVQALQSEELLVVFDNCEHVAPRLAEVVEQLLASCPRLKLIATSRLPLASPSERQLPIGALSIEDGVRLLVDRAPVLEGLLDDRTQVEALVARLDSMPLQLELIAPTLSTASVLQVLDELEGSVASIRGVARSDPRHHSLTSALDWSLPLLAAEDQRLFDELGVLAGEFTAAEVAKLTGQPIRTVRGALARLAAQSLVQPGDPGPAPTFRQLNTVRTFARDRLEASGRLAASEKHHAKMYLELVRKMAIDLAGPNESQAVAELQRSSDQLAAAHSWLLAHGDDQSCMDFVLGMWEYSFLRQDFRKFGWLDQVIERVVPTKTSDYAELLAAGAMSAWAMDRFAASANLVERATAVAEAAGIAIPIYCLKARLNVASHERRMGDAGRALSSLIEASAERSDDRHHADNLVVLTLGMMQFGAEEHALDAAAQATTLAARSENPTSIAWARVGQGTAELNRNPLAAGRAFMAGQSLAVTVNNVWVEGMALTGLATALRRSGRYEQARHVLIDVIDLWARNRTTSQLHRGCVEAVLLLADLDMPEQAARVLAHVDLEVVASPLTLADDRAQFEKVAVELRQRDVVVELRPAEGLGSAVIAQLRVGDK